MSLISSSSCTRVGQGAGDKGAMVVTVVARKLQCCLAWSNTVLYNCIVCMYFMFLAGVSLKVETVSYWRYYDE